MLFRSGIVEELGEIVSKDQLADAARFVIRGPLVTTDAGHGDSIAVNGVCLTVVDVLPDGAFSADVMAETLNRSSLAGVEVGKGLKDAELMRRFCEAVREADARRADADRGE